MTRHFSSEEIETMISGWLLGTDTNGDQTLFYGVDENLFAKMATTPSGIPTPCIVDINLFTTVIPLEAHHLAQINPIEPTLESLYAIAECLEGFFGPGSYIEEDDVFMATPDEEETKGPKNVANLLFLRNKKTIRA